MNVSGRVLYVCRNTNFVHNLTVRNVKTQGVSVAGLGKKKSGPVTSGAVKQRMKVEEDVDKLANYVCGTDIMEGSEPIKLKPDSEYPEWLWNVHTGYTRKYYEFERGTREYYEALKRYNIVKRIHLERLRKVKLQ